MWRPQSQKQFSDSFQNEWNMIAMTVFHLIMNQTEFPLIRNQKKICHHDPCNYKIKYISPSAITRLNVLFLGQNFPHCILQFISQTD